MNDEIETLRQRVHELEGALHPFGEAAYGFINRDIVLQYLETDGEHYDLLTESGLLCTGDLLHAAKVLGFKTD